MNSVDGLALKFASRLSPSKDPTCCDCVVRNVLGIESKVRYWHFSVVAGLTDDVGFWG